MVSDCCLNVSLLHKHQIHGGNKQDEGCEMVPMQTLALEQNAGHDSENHERDTLLYHLELNERERAAIALKSDSIGWHLAAIFEEGYAPRKHYHAYQWPRCRRACLLQSQMAIPGQSHKHVAQQEQQYCIQTIHFSIEFILLKSHK